MLVRNLFTVFFFMVAGSTWSATISIEADDAHPVSTKALTLWFDYPWLNSRLSGKDFINERTTFLDPIESNRNHIKLVTALPPLNGESGPVYLIRSTAGRCDLIYYSIELQEFLPDSVDIDCAFDNLAIIRSRATCSAAGGTWDAHRGHPDKFCIKGNMAQCNERGGKWYRSGMFSHYICDIPYPDGGVPCSDHSQCLGGCYIDRSDPRSADTQGRCRKSNSPHFCLEGVANGRRSGSVMCAE